MGGGAKPTGPHDLPFIVQWPWRRMLKYVFIVSFAVCREMASADASSHRVILCNFVNWCPHTVQSTFYSFSRVCVILYLYSFRA